MVNLQAGIGVAQYLAAGQGNRVQVGHHEAARRGQELFQLWAGIDHGLILVKAMFFISQIVRNGWVPSSESASKAQRK
ncbi:hypothetical protein D3C85_1217490 [compost metagenome]